MARQFSLKEFLRMTPFEKQRLRDSDPEQYQKLFNGLERNFPKEDSSAASGLISGPVTSKSTVHTVE
jgi:hypothetical protein